ncbi:MAG: 6-carboxytetrahydropterin synthase [Thermoanaerobaculia bacterium]
MRVSQPLTPRTPGGVVLERIYTFSASHRYFRPEWTEAKNREVFGRCANSPAHGHNYRLTVEVSGPVDRETGFAVNLPALDELVRVTVVRRLDHAHINDAIPEFAPGREIPTTENLVLWIAAELTAGLPAASRLERVRLAEDDRLASTWSRRSESRGLGDEDRS